ncbi:MAG TPA: beta-L-arabinofuranosidase domain-containing protein [Actinoplanes sp.]|nr:beta-L-arabinofuranosidase domain-containing protein [Actinoplanes sp.]
MITAATRNGRLRPVGDVRITGGLLAARQAANGSVAVPSGAARLESAGNLDNLRLAAKQSTSAEFRGPIFMDSDVYKWLEAAAWEYARNPSPTLLEAQREITALVAAAQQPDGYLNSAIQATGVNRYADLPWSHEHYCAGHLIQAAVAQVRGTGDRALLDVAIRFADHLAGTFGPDRRHDVDGHPIVEMALVELYRETGERRYLDLAGYFVDARGHGLMQGYAQEPTYFSDRVPVREQTTVEGHAVRAVYLAAGAADLALETGDTGLLDALATQFAHMLATKTYLTGGLGSRWDREAFGDEYELPPDRAYAETCAAIGGIQWAYRMLLATGDPGYADAAERMLYNGFLAGVSLRGDEYFYVNPLQHRTGAHPDDNRSPAHGRRGWFDCACCPPNVMRTMASLDSYLATTDDQGLQIHLYAQSTVSAGDTRVEVETDYPWDTRIRVRIVATPGDEWTLSLRVPAWAAGASVDGSPAEPGSYATVRRAWHPGDVVELDLPMPVRFTAAVPRIDAVRGCVAVERGPLVYAVEGPDVDDLSVDTSGGGQAEHRPDLLEGVTVVSLRGDVAGHERAPWPYPEEPPARTGRTAEVTAVPYFAWANRGITGMRVWLPRKD